MITYDEFKKVEIRAGKILSAEKIEGTDKLLRLMVDFGEVKQIVNEVASEAEVVDSKPASGEVTNSVLIKPTESAVTPVLTIPVLIPAPRQIVSGISLYFPDPSVLVGKTCMFVTNLEPRTICGNESNGMLFAVSNKGGGFSLLEPNDTIPAGTMAA